ncbi:hypothetical protein [Kitasatospora camelliae]|uniref:Galactan 5-O-arabinofuranosyltransferase n=1 Tax=Kitasatospora camelliae TaxID=3156397 RepID=A0AAU8JVW4_9ACTN
MSRSVGEWVRGLRWPAAEAAAGAVAALGYTLLCATIDVDPMVRIGQVSGLAGLQLYGALLGLPLLALLVFCAHRGSLRRYDRVKRLVCAALAGLASGALAGGTVVALSGTPWPLGGQDGDPATLVRMANSMLNGGHLPGVYPPGFPAAIALWAKIRYNGIGDTGLALQDLQIAFTALAGPAAYLSWRMLLRPFWALAIALPATVVFLDPIRPYSHVTMIVLMPLFAACLLRLRRIAEVPTRTALLAAAGYGAVLGALFLWYSGWYLWAAPGVLVLALLALPWRQGGAVLRRALAYCATVAAAAALVGSPLLYEILKHGSGVPDRYAYLAVYADPGYVLGWASDRAGAQTYHTWPASGELAGQTGFAVLLLAAVGLGIGLGLRHVAVKTAAVVLAGAWLLRFWFASRMEDTQAVQLYPRTTWIILYCLMILAVVGLMAAVERVSARWLSGSTGPAAATAARVRPGAVQQLAAGLVCALALFGAMGTSWSVNRYLPEDPGLGTMGLDAWRAHTVKLPGGGCPKYSPVQQCQDIDVSFFNPGDDQDQKLWCGALPGPDWPTVCGRRAPWLAPEQ